MVVVIMSVSQVVLIVVSLSRYRQLPFCYANVAKLNTTCAQEDLIFFKFHYFGSLVCNLTNNSLIFIGLIEDSLRNRIVI